MSRWLSCASQSLRNLLGNIDPLHFTAKSKNPRAKAGPHSVQAYQRKWLRVSSVIAASFCWSSNDIRKFFPITVFEGSDAQPNHFLHGKTSLIAYSSVKVLTRDCPQRSLRLSIGNAIHLPSGTRTTMF